MSLVEKALRKLQASGIVQPAPSLPSEPVARVEPALERREARRPTGPVARSERTRLGAARAIDIDLSELRNNAIVPPSTEERQLGEQFRTIKRRLIENAFQAPKRREDDSASPRSIIITSALPGDGKTFTAINLAFSLAREKDLSVVLVDADVAKRDVSRLFGMADAAGLLDAVTDPRRPIESVVAPTNLPGLSVLPAGHVSDTATELLASVRMREVMSSLMALDSQHLVVVDSPPILLTSEAPVLASLFGQIVIVVRAGVTPQQAVLDSIRIVGPDNRVSLVLNGAEVTGPPGYRTGYGYHRSSTEPETSGD